MTCLSNNSRQGPKGAPHTAQGQSSEIDATPVFITIRVLGNRTEASTVVLPEKGEAFTLTGAGRNGAGALSDITKQACKKGLTGRSWVTSDGLRGTFAPRRRRPRAKKVIPDPLTEWGPYRA